MKMITKIVKMLMTALPAVVTIALTVCSNSVTSSFNGQPMPPKSLKNYRKF